ncbi:paraflagellar rod protein, putative [Trypanosoma brucei brucei TREU927]|uniref:Paraflagellar rod protein, putative n=1 Tax=Trypanosoma brucei brucei (strain 927/4 GUTat10.1) TaxID=185431 RepID=Q57XR7_TRYB2|nr:paraflagellar rod protein, putative [Trypanosoma brucei brucei TREU927]AAX69601.1 paraflagellar rod protein, putative [Trypanosoma brucei]AAZ12758.1 paraflagellar rod protein, putative [Trypanosoma brucei brucei TREU927]
MTKKSGHEGGTSLNGNGSSSTTPSNTVPTSLTFAGSVAATRKTFLQREAVLDACAVTTNNVALAQARRTALRDSGARIVKLFEELAQTYAANMKTATASQEGSGTGTPSAKDGPITVEQLNMINCMAEAYAESFRKECGLELALGDMVMSDAPANTSKKENDNSGSRNHNSASKGGDSTGGEAGGTAAGPAQEAIRRRIAPLQRALASAKELRNIPTYNKVLSVAQRGNVGANSLTTLVKNLTETLEESLQELEGGYGSCSNSANDVAEWACWVQPLVRLTNECLQTKPLEKIMEGPRERLRRVAFDVEEKQREQEDAVTDGDMVRSEQLYFEKTALLESMRPIYDELEAAIEESKRASVDEPSKELRSLVKELSTKQAPKVLDREKQVRRRGKTDLERLLARREEIMAARTKQTSTFKVYLAEWDKMFRHNEQQQENCLRAIEELEQRLKYLSEERAILVEDRLEVAAQEQQRSEDAASFMLFAAQHEQKLRKTIENLDQSLSCGERVLEVVRSSYHHLGKYLQDMVQREADEQLLEVRKERLSHFRGLYLTLGELKYKKERHLEELDKRIEYYHVQQELAMDTFNPKAKEFSKAKKDLLEVKETMQQQIDLIGQKAVKQLEDFKPTEQLLLASGVKFVHPVKELEEMNQRRTQKLLEYHNLMSTIGDGRSREEAEANGKVAPKTSS